MRCYVALGVYLDISLFCDNNTSFEFIIHRANASKDTLIEEQCRLCVWDLSVYLRQIIFLRPVSLRFEDFLLTILRNWKKYLICARFRFLCWNSPSSVSGADIESYREPNPRENQLLERTKSYRGPNSWVAGARSLFFLVGYSTLKNIRYAATPFFLHFAEIYILLLRVSLLGAHKNLTL